METKGLGLLNEREKNYYFNQPVERQGPLLCNGWIAVMPMYSKKLLLLRCSSIFPNTWWKRKVGERQ